MAGVAAIARLRLQSWRPLERLVVTRRRSSRAAPNPARSGRPAPCGCAPLERLLECGSAKHTCRHAARCAVRRWRPTWRTAPPLEDVLHDAAVSLTRPPQTSPRTTAGASTSLSMAPLPMEARSAVMRPWCHLLHARVTRSPAPSRLMGRC